MLQNLDIVPSTESRNELLAWLNETMPQVAPNGMHVAPVHKVEQCGNGVAYILTLPTMLPILYPPLKSAARVKIPALHDFEAVANLKLMQDALQRNGIARPDVLLYHTSKLIKGNFQANLQLLQWFKGLYDALFVKDVEQSLRRSSARGLHASGTSAVPASSEQVRTPVTTSIAAKPATSRARSPPSTALQQQQQQQQAAAALSEPMSSTSRTTAAVTIPATSAVHKPEPAHRTPHTAALPASSVRRDSTADSETRAVNAQGDAAAAAALALLTSRAERAGEANAAGHTNNNNNNDNDISTNTQPAVRRGSLNSTQRTNSHTSPTTNTPIVKHLPAAMTATSRPQQQRVVSMSPPRELEPPAPQQHTQTTQTIQTQTAENIGAGPVARRLATPRSRSHSDSQNSVPGRPKSATGTSRPAGKTAGNSAAGHVVRPRTPRSPSYSASYSTQTGTHGSTPRVSSSTITTNTNTNTKNTKRSNSSGGNGLNSTQTPRSPSLSNSMRKTRATTPSQARPAGRTRLNEAPPVSFAGERKANNTPRLLSSTAKAKTRLPRTAGTSKLAGKNKSTNTNSEEKSTSVSPDVSEARLATPQQVTSTTSFTSCVEGTAAGAAGLATHTAARAAMGETDEAHGTEEEAGDFLRRGDAAVPQADNNTTHMILHRARSPLSSPHMYPVVDAQQDHRNQSLPSTTHSLPRQSAQMEAHTHSAEAHGLHHAGLSPHAEKTMTTTKTPEKGAASNEHARSGHNESNGTSPMKLDAGYLHQVERERQFYYDKLRTIETMVAPLAARESMANATDAMRLARSICTVLYMPD